MTDWIQGIRPSHHFYYRTRCALVALIALSPLATTAQTEPLTERVPNTALLIDLAAGPPPATLSATGLFSDMAAQTVAPGIIPYAVNAELWSDGAYKTRFFALPGTTQIDFTRQGPWGFPPNSVLVKNFYLEFVKGDPTSRQIVETRLLVKDGAREEWLGFSYQWNDDATEAHLLRESAHQTFFIVDPAASDGIAQQRYFYPGPQDCTLCHREVAGRILGPKTAQLNRLAQYGETSEHQLRALNRIGLFSEDIGESFNDLPRWADPGDEKALLAARARGYLAANCAHCHTPGGVERADMDLRHDTPLAQTRTVGISPSLGRLDAEPENVRIISPGDPDHSTLLLRMMNFSSFRMPPVASSVHDEEGTQLLRAWIASLSPSTEIAGLANLPDHFSLAPNYPNPFNPATTISYRIATPGRVDLGIFNVLGQPVRTLIQGPRNPGQYTIQWDGHHDGGQPAASGVYIYRLNAPDGTLARPLLLLR